MSKRRASRLLDIGGYFSVALRPRAATHARSFDVRTPKRYFGFRPRARDARRGSEWASGQQEAPRLDESSFETHILRPPCGTVTEAVVVIE